MSLLRADGLVLRAGGRADARVLVDAAGFSVAAGERWVVLGPNGAGKSSLLAALAGVFPIAGGQLFVDERPLAAWPLRDLAERRAWCPQFWIDPFAATVDETVRLARERGAFWPWRERTGGRDTEVDHTIERLDLQRLRSSDVRTLSGGERQRVAIATCLLQGAPLMLLDEPASHLDLAHQQMLIGLLRERADAGDAIVASLHDLNLAWDLASHALLLDGRGAVAAGLREVVLTPARLSAAFGITVDQVELCGQRRFWIGPLR
jgi:iron complex transport system ATP-binding protein